MTTATRLNDVLATTAMADLSDLTIALAGLKPLPKRLDRPLVVAEAAELLELSPHTLRYYERGGLVEVDRDAAGNRAYDMTALVRVPSSTTKSSPTAANVPTAPPADRSTPSSSSPAYRHPLSTRNIGS